MAGAGGGWAEMWPVSGIAAPRAVSIPALGSIAHVPMDWDTLAGSPYRDALDVSRCSLLDLTVGSYCGVLGCPQRPFCCLMRLFVLSSPSGSLCTALHMQELSLTSSSILLLSPWGCRAPLALPGNVQSPGSHLAAGSCSCSESMWVCMGDLV